MQRAVILCGTASFIMAFLGTILALSLLAPSSASAQSSEAQIVRASGFELVASDGTVLARLAPGGPGSGSFSLFDTGGLRRVLVSGGGTITTFEPDGTTATFSAGRRDASSPVGEPAVNGVVLGPS